MNRSDAAPFRLAARGRLRQFSAMQGRVFALYRHPVKGFTPERLDRAELVAGGFFPHDRLYAVEDGPSAFDPGAPAFVPKTAFTVLAKLPQVARVRTAYDETTATLHAEAPGRRALAARLDSQEGRDALAAWLQELLAEDASGPLKVVSAPGHRFTDHPQGHVSLINLESLRHLERRIGRRVDPLRFRGNLLIDGWDAWAENGWIGRTLQVGGARLEVFKPIVRCAATEVDPHTAERDLQIPKALFDHYRHILCGIYASVVEGGVVEEGAPAVLV